MSRFLYVSFGNIVTGDNQGTRSTNLPQPGSQPKFITSDSQRCQKEIITPSSVLPAWRR